MRDGNIAIVALNEEMMLNKSDTIELFKSLAVLMVLAALSIPFILMLNKADDSKQRLFDPAIAAYQQGHYAEAEDKLKWYLAARPDQLAGLYNLGLCALAEGKKDEARSDFKSSAAHSGVKVRAWCGGQPCDDLAEGMLTWMDRNPTWDASQATSVPPFPSAP